jgi:REP-associated tyrosine transposase
MKQFYRHRLPHWQPPGAIIFITYRLFGSLPAQTLARLAEEKQRLSKELPRAGEPQRERALRDGKRLFALLDDALDTPQSGPKWLTDNAVAEILIENLFHHAGQLFRLWAFVVMPNHVHLLIEPLTISKDFGSESNDDDFVAISRITHALKSYTAKRANLVLNRKGTFWQEESFDHWVRDEKEFARIVAYIENNPTKAGLVDSPEKWQGSSAAFERGDEGACINRRGV